MLREERRRKTEQRILAQARALFGEQGFERTTIRAVAESAGVDPALVMQYFKSKQGLFTAATRVAPEPAFAGQPERLVDFLLETLRLKLNESGPEPMAMLRSMLTHPAATEQARQVVRRQSEQIAQVLRGRDRQLRAGLIVTILLGIRIGRDLLQLEPLGNAPPERVLRLMRPVFQALSAASNS
jgi:AcrR family transcriptional regulator